MGNGFGIEVRPGLIGFILAEASTVFGAGRLGAVRMRGRQNAIALCSMVFGITAVDAGNRTHAEKTDCALELVLAVDVSGSVDHYNYNLQMRGYSAAFRNPSVLQAIHTLGPGGVAVTLMQWGNATEQDQTVQWAQVMDEATADKFASAIDSAPRKFNRTGTAIGAAMSYAANLIEANGFHCGRRIIDVSGDGRSNGGPEPAIMCDAVVSAGITINGLAITNSDEMLDVYYSAQVAGGRGAFVLMTSSYEDIATTIRKKLLRELSPSLSQKLQVPD